MFFEEILQGVANNTLTKVEPKEQLTYTQLKLLLTALKKNHSVKEIFIKLYPNDSPENNISQEVKELASLLAKSSPLKLERLYFINANIGNDGAEVIAAALVGNHTLRELNLGLNAIQDKGCISLANVLNSCSLTTLILSNNEVGDAGAIEIAETLRFNTTLTRVNLCFNQINYDGITRFHEALLTNFTIEDLELRANPKDNTKPEIDFFVKQQLEAFEKKIARNQIARLRELSIQQGSQLTQVQLMLSELQLQLNTTKSLDENEPSSPTILSFRKSLSTVFSEESSFLIAVEQFKKRISGIPKVSVTYQANDKNIHLNVSGDKKSLINTQASLTIVRDSLVDILGTAVLAKVTLIDSTLTLKTHNPKLSEQLMTFLEKSGISRLKASLNLTGIKF